MSEKGFSSPRGGEETAPGKDRFAVEVYEWVEWLAGVAVLAVLLLTFLASTVIVFGPSMKQTLQEGDRLIVTRLGGFERGDIVAIAQPSDVHKPLIKRIIAKGGQTVDIDFESGGVTVDGELLEERYLNTPTNVYYDVAFPQTVPEGCVFAMGDNRNESWDSRASEIGMIDERYILGKALFRFAPLDRIGTL